MGCVSSRQAVTPAFDYSSGAYQDNESSASGRRNHACEGEKKKKKTGSGSGGSEFGGSKRGSFNCDADYSLSLRLGNLNRHVEGEQVAAGWPAWLSAEASEAIQGWVPFRADSFEKLEKIGQGTYSSVFRARELDTGRIVALKKVRFDNFEPESVRFMAREILILRRLDHPNIVKLLGLVTSRLSCSIYLVFEYMEHDIAGLSSSPEIKFSEAQVKCYMQQLLSGLEHCHSRGVMHRDIKGSNLLVSNEGILKIADFGLANFVSTYRQPLTSRVVTLWYRPPELLLGSTDYEASVDLWSVGCVFAELFLGKPMLQGRTEVEQLHKIFKLCGSPPDEYWKKSKLPHATIFKPQHPYERSLPEVCKEMPKTAFQLIETFLSVEPYKRGSASSALASEYFTTKPYACDPSTLPKYAPNKEIDAKSREEARRKKNGGRARGNEVTRRQVKGSKALRDPNGHARSITMGVDLQDNTKLSHKIKSNSAKLRKDVDAKPNGERFKPSLDMKSVSLETVPFSSHTSNASQDEVVFSGPLHVTASSGFAWAKRRKEDFSSMRSTSRSSSRGQVLSAIDPSSVLTTRNTSESKHHDNVEAFDGNRTNSRANSRGHNSYEVAKVGARKEWNQFDRPDSFDGYDGYHSQELSASLYQKNDMALKGYDMGYQDQEGMVEFSGPLLSQAHQVDELLERHERHIRQAVRRSWFQKVKKDGK